MAMVSSAASASANDAVFFALPKATHARSITAGPEKSIWFSGVHAPELATGEGVIGRVTVNGEVSDFVVPPKRSVGDIAGGSDGNLWFTESYENKRSYLVSRIARVSPTGEFSEYRLGDNVGSVMSIAGGPDGNLWFTTRYWSGGRRHHAVGRITMSGTVTLFPLSPRSQPGAIVAGPDGNLWFTEQGHGAAKIGRITTSGRITHFPLRRARYPRSIATGPDGNLWFTEGYRTYSRHPKNKIGRITTSGTVTEFSVPGEGGTEAIAAGPAGNIWFATRLDRYRVAVASITPAGMVTVPTCLDSKCELAPDALAIGPEGDLWFAAGKRLSGEGGGGSLLLEGNQIAQEAGFVGRFSPSQS
jgi:virginiamycin B lyase